MSVNKQNKSLRNIRVTALQNPCNDITQNIIK